MNQLLTSIIISFFISLLFSCENNPQQNVMKYDGMRYLGNDTLFCIVHQHNQGIEVRYLMSDNFNDKVEAKSDTFPSYEGKEEGFYFYGTLFKKLEEKNDTYRDYSSFSLDSIDIIYDSLIENYQTGNFVTDSCYVYKIIPPKESFMELSTVRFFIDFKRKMVLKGNSLETDKTIFEIISQHE